MRRRWFERLVTMVILLLPMASLAADFRDIKVDGKKPAEFVAERTGKSWAVVIGIDEYEKAPKLKYAGADAKAVAGALARQGFQVTSLYDEQATRSNILGALGDTLVDQVGEQDRVVIFFAGHGETKKAKGGRTTGYLVPVGGEAAALAQTAISMSMIRDLSEALPAKHVLFLIDVCYGGIAGTLGRSMPPMTESYLREITRERGRQLITAGGPDQRALEGPEWGHSVFTYYLLEGLEKGLADLNEDGIIPASELYAYLDARVFGAAALKGHVQRPERWDLAAEKGEFVFFTSVVRQGSPQASAGGLAPAEATRRRVPVPGVPSAALSQAEQELKALEEQERQAEEQKKLAEIQKQIEEKRTRIEAEKKKLEVASLPSYSAPKQTGKEFTGKDGAAMVLISAGEFWMGSAEEEIDRLVDDCKRTRKKTDAACRAIFQGELPRHRVTLSSFYMEKHEVTNRLFEKFVSETGHRTTAEQQGWGWVVAEQDGRPRKEDGATWRNPAGRSSAVPAERDDHPVAMVSWSDAEAYCRWAGKRLPTEAEWEYAARAGTSGASWWGDRIPPTQRVANLADKTARRQYPGLDVAPGYDDGSAQTAPVGSYLANQWGLHDVIGNLWEWTVDWFDAGYYSQSRESDPQGPAGGQYKVVRGGSWRNLPALARAAYRGAHGPDERSAIIGFRCVQDVK